MTKFRRLNFIVYFTRGKKYDPVTDEHGSEISEHIVNGWFDLNKIIGFREGVDGEFVSGDCVVVYDKSGAEITMPYDLYDFESILKENGVMLP